MLETGAWRAETTHGSIPSPAALHSLSLLRMHSKLYLCVIGGKSQSAMARREIALLDIGTAPLIGAGEFGSVTSQCCVSF